MNLLGQILLALFVIAALQGIVAVLAVGVILVLLCGLIWRPTETVPILLFLLLLEGLGRWPLATVGSLIVLGGAFWIASRAKRARAAVEQPVALLPNAKRWKSSAPNCTRRAARILTPI